MRLDSLILETSVNTLDKLKDFGFIVSYQERLKVKPDPEIVDSYWRTERGSKIRLCCVEKHLDTVLSGISCLILPVSKGKVVVSAFQSNSKIYSDVFEVEDYEIRFSYVGAPVKISQSLESHIDNFGGTLKVEKDYLNCIRLFIAIHDNCR